MANEEVKPFWESKTFWLNIVMGIGSFVPQVKQHLTPELLTGVFAGVNIILRFISSGKVTLK